jgi:hypothetical protein
MKTHAKYLLIGICLVLGAFTSNAQITIWVDSYTLNISDTASGSHSYVAWGRIEATSGTPSPWVHLNPYNVSASPNTMQMQSFYPCPNTPNVYSIHVRIIRDGSDYADQTSSGQLPDRNFHISPVSIDVKF